MSAIHLNQPMMSVCLINLSTVSVFLPRSINQFCLSICLYIRLYIHTNIGTFRREMTSLECTLSVRPSTAAMSESTDENILIYNHHNFGTLVNSFNCVFFLLNKILSIMILGRCVSEKKKCIWWLTQSVGWSAHQLETSTPCTIKPIETVVVVLGVDA